MARIPERIAKLLFGGLESSAMLYDVTNANISNDRFLI